MAIMTRIITIIMRVVMISPPRLLVLGQSVVVGEQGRRSRRRRPTKSGWLSINAITETRPVNGNIHLIVCKC